MALEINIDDRISNKLPLPTDWNASDKTRLNADHIMTMLDKIVNGEYRTKPFMVYEELTDFSTVVGEDGELLYCQEDGKVYKWSVSEEDWILFIDLSAELATKVDKETGKGLSTNDLTNTLKSNYDTAYTNNHTHTNKTILDNTTASYTTAEQSKLSGIEAGAEVNVIEAVEVNGEVVPVENKVAKITVGGSEPEIIMPFKQFDNVLSGQGARNVASNDNFFIFSNGDVSKDGKTIIKTNADFGAEFSMTANNDYVIVNDGYQQANNFRIKIYTIGTDGTLTLVREFARANGFNKVKIVNGKLFLYDGALGGGGFGFYYIALTDIENEAVSMTFVSGDGKVRGIDYDTENEQYVVIIQTGYYISSDLDTIFSTALITLPDPKGTISFGNIIDGELVLGSGDENAGVYYLHHTIIGSGTVNTITLPITLQYQQIRDLKQLCNQYIMLVYNGFDGITYYYTATSFSGFRAVTEGIGYQVAYIDSSYVITLNNRNILWSGPKEIVYNDFQKLGYSQLADKTIENTDVETSIINTTAGEYVGSNVIPANSLTAGDVITVRAKGVISTASSAPTTTLKAKLGSVVLIESSGALPTDWDGVYFELNTEIAIRAIGATGKAIIGGNTLFKDATTISAGIQRILKGVEIEINTIINNTLDITYTWSTASTDNSITVKQAHFEIKRQW